MFAGKITVVCAVVLMALTAVAKDNSASMSLLRPGKAADPAAAPMLRVLDGEGALRWQVPVGLWTAPRSELGGYNYPCGVPLDRAFVSKGPLVFVGYGLTRDNWDDYAGQRVDGSIAVVLTGVPQIEVSAEGTASSGNDAWVALIQEKVENARAHGAVAVLLERNPLLPPCQGDVFPFPKNLVDVPMAAPAVVFWAAGQLSLPTFSAGQRTLETILAFSSDLFEESGPGAFPLRMLIQDAENEKRGLGPISLNLSAEVSWGGGLLRKRSGHRCDIWYQPGSPAERDISELLAACDSTLQSLESLLSARLSERVTVLLFADWRSKLFCTSSLGAGHASGTRTAMVYEGTGGAAGAILAHEMCHLVAEVIGRPPACFDEGLGRLVGDTVGNLGLVQAGSVDADRATAANLRAGRLWSLRELLDIPRDEWGLPERRPLVSYPEAASFCAYLIRRVGFNGFRDLYVSLKQDDSQGNVQLLERTLGESLDAIEADWHRIVLSGSAETKGIPERLETPD